MGSRKAQWLYLNFILLILLIYISLIVYLVYPWQAFESNHECRYQHHNNNLTNNENSFNNKTAMHHSQYDNCSNNTDLSSLSNQHFYSEEHDASFSDCNIRWEDFCLFYQNVMLLGICPYIKDPLFLKRKGFLLRKKEGRYPDHYS